MQMKWITEEFGEPINRKTVIAQELLLKDERVTFWETHHSMPKPSDLEFAHQWHNWKPEATLDT
jgi:hypothetical protein